MFEYKYSEVGMKKRSHILHHPHERMLEYKYSEVGMKKRENERNRITRQLVCYKLPVPVSFVFMDRR
jgi:hypothetical protein